MIVLKKWITWLDLKSDIIPLATAQCWPSWFSGSQARWWSASHLCRLFLCRACNTFLGLSYQHDRPSALLEPKRNKSNSLDKKCWIAVLLYKHYIFSIYLWNGSHYELINASLWVVHFLLHKSRINNIIDSINGQGCLCDVCSNDNLSAAWRCRIDRIFSFNFGFQRSQKM